MTYRCVAILVALMMFSPVVGCTGSSSPTGGAAETHDHDHDHDHEHEDAPATYTEAVAKLESMRDHIRDAFAAGDEDGAHDPLHEIGHVLEHVGELAEKEAEIDAAAAKHDADELFELFNKVDEKLHGHEGATYDEVSADIDAAIARLKSRIPGETAAEPTAEGQN